jgi:hypothetical protein
MVAHTLARAVGAADFSTTEKRRRECAGCRAQPARVSGSDDATHRQLAYLGYPVAPMVAHKLAWFLDMTDFRLPRNGGENRTGGCRVVDACACVVVREIV